MFQPPPAGNHSVGTRRIPADVDLRRLHDAPLEEVLREAWAVRAEHHGTRLDVRSPTLRLASIGKSRPRGSSFITVSVTGASCALDCDHCAAKVLANMQAAGTPQQFETRMLDMIEKGLTGILLSGGSRPDGSVPLEPYLPVLPRLKEAGLERILVHSGPVNEEQARLLGEAPVDQVMLDIMGAEETIHDVYHMPDRQPSDFLGAMRRLKDAGCSVAPHIVIGLHYGQIVGEWHSLEMINEVGPDAIVFVVFSPLPGTPAWGAPTVPNSEIARLLAAARITNPQARVTLGCVKPPKGKEEMERMALQAGVNSVALPMQQVVDYAQSDLGLEPNYAEYCCSMG